VVAYLLLTAPSWEEEQQHRLDEIRRIGERMGQERERITQNTLERMASAAREAAERLKKE
jgi:hypothetical protein